jgi:hypothetical protein
MWRAGTLRELVFADAMLEPGFEEALCDFCRAHMHDFDGFEENKLEHMSVFQEYVALVEEQLEARLAQRQPDFDMAQFLQARHGVLLPAHDP